MRPERIVDPSDLILITGANGFLGLKVVETALAFGFQRLRCLVRSSKNAGELRRVVDASSADVEVVQGNLLSRDDCRYAAQDASIVLHLAAGTGKSFAGCFLDSVVATRNLLDAALEHGQLKRFVSLSSLAVHSGFESRRGELLDENSPIERDHMKRFDPYCYGKIKQDEIVETYGRDHGIPYVIVRPGPIYGPGKRALTGRVGIDTFGIFISVGGSNQIPLIYIDNCADAVVLAGIVEGIDRQVVIAVDDELPTGREFLRLYKNNVRRFRSIGMPYGIFYVLNWIWENYSIWSEGQLPPAFNRRQCAAYYKSRHYSNRKLKELTGWTPRVSFPDASKQYFDFMRLEEAR